MGTYFSYEQVEDVEASEQTINNRNQMLKEIKKRKVDLNQVEPEKPLYESIIIPKCYVQKKLRKKKKKKM